MTLAPQRRYYAESCDPQFEIGRPYNCGRLYEFLIAHKLHAALDALGDDVAGQSVLDVCCGSGMISEALARRGAIVTGIDASDAAIGRAHERACRHGFTADFLVGDATALPFGGGVFDVVAVHDGLHHLDDPAVALREMARVARTAVVVMEPAAAALTRVAVRLGVAENVEDAGNEVRRLRAADVAETLRAAGFPHVRWRRSLMYYPHEPFGWFRWFDRTPLFVGFRAGFWVTDTLLGRFGNKLALAARTGTVAEGRAR